MKKIRYVVSACLSGEQCRYDGDSNYNERIANLVKEGWAVLICPEVMGGLSIPRVPCEIQPDGRVINQEGQDKTSEYVFGSEKSLEIAQKFNIKKAILKSKSPACGNKQVYDGTFTKTLIDGKGVAARLLEENNIKVYSEKDEVFYDAVVVAAGNGQRCGLPYNKVFHFSGNVTVIEKAVEPFVSDFLCGKVIVVCKKEEQPMFEALLPYAKICYAEGGSCREESVLNGLKLVTAKNVLIHDAARANISTKLVDKVVESLQKGFECVVPYIVSEKENNDFMVEDKSIQTPQGYEKEILWNEMISKDDLSNYRDESSILSSSYTIKYIPGETINYKITTKEDLIKWQLRNQEEE